MTYDIAKHILVPKHSKLKEQEKAKLLENLHLTVKELPKISKDDPAIAKLDVKAGDVIKIERESKTAGTAFYFRAVTED